MAAWQPQDICFCMSEQQTQSCAATDTTNKVIDGNQHFYWSNLRNARKHNLTSSWQNCTRKIITHRQELLTKYDVNATVDSRSIDFLEGVDKILSNVIRILDKRRIRSKYSRMFTNWQDFTMIGQYVAQYDMRSIAKNFRLWRQFVSGKHFEGYRAQR